MLSKSQLQKSINEIYKIYQERNVLNAFTLNTVSAIFDIGSEVFMKNNPEEYEKLSKRPPTKAPDIFEDEPHTFKRTFEIYGKLNEEFSEVTPALISKIFEINSQLAWDEYRKRYDKYILEIYIEYPHDEYINYLAAVVLYDKKEYRKALKCINIASAGNISSANFIHLKGLCMLQLGEFDSARTYFYQALFLVELIHETRRHIKKNRIYPNYPVEFHTSVELVRADLKKLDKMENLYHYQLLPFIESIR